ncbi:MAG TPA: VTT domain-containing protein [Bacilli bacterium]
MTENTEKRTKIRRLIIVLIAILIIIGIILALYYGFGLNKKFHSPEATKEFLLQYGGYSRAFFALLNFLQTTLIPISNLPTIFAGLLLFSPFEVFVLTTIGVYLGSIASFIFGKLFGKKAVEWVLGEKTVNHYLEIAKGREQAAIFMMLLLPSFPDDILCIIAGITPMSFRFFLVMLLLTRTLPTVVMVYFADKIPNFGWWGILIVIVYIGLFFLFNRMMIKKWDKISEFIDKIKRKFFKKTENSEK